MATSRWVFGWIIGQWLAQADRQLTITVPVKCFFLGKIPTFALWLLHSAVHLCFLWDTLSVGSKISEAYRYCGHDRELPGKKEYLLKSLKCKTPSSDLWSSGVWGLVQTWAGRTISLFWSLSVPHPGKPGVRLSDVSVWVTCFLLQVAYALQDWWLAYWWVIPDLTQSTVKSAWNLTFPQSGGEGRGLFSLLFWLSHSFPEKK